MSETNPLTGLQKLICGRFNMEEIRTLCFDLALDFDDLGGEKSLKTYQLLIYCCRRGMLEQLTQLIIQERPDLKDELLTDLQTYCDALDAFNLVVQMPELGESSELFINRAEIRRRLGELLRNPSRDVYIVVGLPGVGKSALAARVANEVAGAFPGGIIWLPFESKPTLEHLCSTIVDAYQATPAIDMVQAAINLLKKYRPLLVLDNVDSSNLAFHQFMEKVREATTVFSPMLVTTTDRVVADYGKSLVLEPLERQHAMTLFVSRLEQEVSEADTPLVNTLCGLVGDLPLAIRLMTSYIYARQTSLTEYLIILNESTLGQAMEMGVRREKSVQVTFQRSFERLTDEARLALTVFALDGGESVTLLALASGMNKPESIARQAGGELVQYSLASRDGHERYRLHPIVRRFALEQVTKQKARAIRKRLIAYYKTYVHEHNRESSRDYVALDRNRSNIWAILEYLEQTHNWALLIEVAFDLRYFMDVRGYWREERKRLEQGLSVLQDIYQGVERERIQIKLQLVLGFMLYRLAEFEEAEKQLLASLALSHQLGDRELEQKNVYNLGFVYLEAEADTEEAYVANHEKALTQFGASLLLAEQLNDPRAIIMGKQQMGKCLANLGRHPEAGAVLKECLTIYKSSGLDDERLPAFTRFYLGLNAHLQPGNEREALGEYSLALELSRLVGDRLLTATTLTNIAEAEYTSGEIAEAQNAFLEARGLTEKLQDALLASYHTELITQYANILRAT